MGAVAIYILNAVIYRPAANAMDKTLEQACVCHGSDNDEEDPHIIPTRDSRGLYFLSDVIYDNDVFRLPRIRLLTGVEIAKIYAATNLNSLHATFFARSIAAQKRQEHGLRPRSNRTRRPPMTVLVQRPADNPLPVHNFGLGPLNAQLEQGHQLHGPDDAVAQALDEPQQDPDARISEIWNQLLVDIFQVSPNPRSRHSAKYTTLTLDEIQAVSEETFKQTELPFTDVTIKQVDRWRICR